MVSDPLENSWAKFYWASQHMTAVDKALKRSIDPNLHAVSFEVEIETQANGGTGIVQISTLPHLRDDCGLAIGDVIQNFRAALDHLTWDLVRIGATPRPKRPQMIQFPMANSYKSFKGQVGDRLPGVPNDQRAIILRYQPYRRGNGPMAIRWLRNFSDKDKHRVLIPTVVNVAGITNLNITSSWPMNGMTYLVKKPRPLNVGTKVLQLDMSPGTGDCQVNVNGEVALFPSLGYGRNILLSLGLIRETVLEILSQFDDII